MEETKERQRKDNIKRGQRTQKMVNFRADLDVVEILNHVANKGRFMNDAIRALHKAKNREEHDYSPDENDITEES